MPPDDPTPPTPPTPPAPPAPPLIAGKFANQALINTDTFPSEFVANLDYSASQCVCVYLQPSSGTIGHGCGANTQLDQTVGIFFALYHPNWVTI